jgi:nucleolar protein 14
MSLIIYCVDLIQEFANHYVDLPSFKEIFETILNLLNILSIKNYSQLLKEKINNLKGFITKISETPKEQLKLIVRKPTQIAQLEPKIEARSRHDPKHHNTIISEKQLNQKRYKKELKGAIKELRKDNQFLAKVQYDEMMEKYVSLVFVMKIAIL